MKKQILFVHSAGAQGPGEGSYGLLNNLIAMIGEKYQVVSPKMPNPEYPEYGPWKTHLRKELLTLNGRIIFVGHSLGGSVLLKYLSEEGYKNNNIEGLFLIATPCWGEKDWEIEEFELEKNFALKLPKIPAVFFYHSLDDRTVPYSHMVRYAERFPHAKIRKFGGSDHAFDSGIPELVRDIKTLK